MMCCVLSRENLPLHANRPAFALSLALDPLGGQVPRPAHAGGRFSKRLPGLSPRAAAMGRALGEAVAEGEIHSFFHTRTLT